MRLQDFLDAQNLDLKITRYNNQDERWSARFDRCDVAEDGLIRSASGNGHGPRDAIFVYIEQIAGKRMKTDQDGVPRYFTVPKDLTF